MLAAVFARFFSGVSLFCFGLALVGCLYAVFAAVCALRFARRCEAARRAPHVGDEPGVSLLKPLHGAEPGLAEALATACRQTYTGPLNVVFGTASADDTAVPVARSVMRQNPGCASELVIDGTRHGGNGKVSNLINMRGGIRHAVVVLADSDIVVPPDHLRLVTRALAAPAVGAVTCLYHGLPANAGLWSRLAAAAIDWHFLPSVLVGTTIGLAQPCMGSTIALRRETLERIGGFAVLADQLADDYALGAQVRRLGLRTDLAPVVVGHLCQETTFGELWRHELRWARTIRLVDPLGFFGSVVTHPIPLALIGAAAWGFVGGASLAVLGSALVARAILATGAARLLPGRRLDFRLLIARDILSFAVFAASFFALRVRWRGLDFNVAGDGTMQPLTIVRPSEPRQTPKPRWSMKTRWPMKTRQPLKEDPEQ